MPVRTTHLSTTKCCTYARAGLHGYTDTRVCANNRVLKPFRPPIERQLSFSPSDASNRIRLTLYLSKLANRFGRDPEQHQGMQGELPQASDIAFDVKQRGGNGRYAGVRRGQRRRPPRTRARPQAWLRRNSNCACSNLFSCLLRGGRLEPDQSRGGGDGTRRSCPGVAEVCCSAPQPYNPFSSFLSRQFRKPARAWKGRRRKSRRLTRLPPVSYSGAKAVKLPTSLAGQQALYASNFIEDPEDYTVNQFLFGTNTYENAHSTSVQCFLLPVWGFAPRAASYSRRP